MFQYITLVHHLKLYNISFFSLNSLENQLYFYMNELNIEIRSGAMQYLINNVVNCLFCDVVTRRVSAVMFSSGHYISLHDFRLSLISSFSISY